MSGKYYALLVLCASLLFVPSLRAQNSSYAADFLQIPVGSHAEAMGGAFTALANDQSAFHFNPAGVSFVDHKNLGLMYSSEYGLPGSSLASFWHFGATLPLNNITIAANWVRLAIADLEHTPDLTAINVTALRQEYVRNANGSPKDYFSDNEDEYVFTVAHDTRINVDWGWLYYEQPIDIPIGVNFKVLHQKIGDFAQASGIGVDAGAMFKFSLGQFLLLPFLGDLTASVSVTDIGGTRMHWSTEREHVVPMRIIGGGAYKQQVEPLLSTFTFAGDFVVKEHSKPRLGFDWTYREILSLRAGLNQGNFTTGAGFVWGKKVTLDYSLALHDLGAIHRLTLNADLDNIFGKGNATK